MPHLTLRTLGLCTGLAILTGVTGCASVNRAFDSVFGGARPAAAAPAAVQLPWGTSPAEAAAATAAAAAAAVSSAPRTTAATAPSTAGVVTDPAYVIGPEDALEISVWKEDNLKSSTLVRPDGGISFPLAGDFIVAGKTAAEVRDELVRRLTRFVPEPEVTVAVVRVASYRIYVIGRVNKPGDITVGRNLDVLQALSLAGGMTPFANEDSIRIIRRVDGKQVAIPFDYTRLRRGGDLAQNITLKSGDVLFVP